MELNIHIIYPHFVVMKTIFKNWKQSATETVRVRTVSRCCTRNGDKEGEATRVRSQKPKTDIWFNVHNDFQDFFFFCFRMKNLCFCVCPNEMSFIGKNNRIDVQIIWYSGLRENIGICPIRDRLRQRKHSFFNPRNYGSRSNELSNLKMLIVLRSVYDFVIRAPCTRNENKKGSCCHSKWIPIFGKFPISRWWAQLWMAVANP